MGITIKDLSEMSGFSTATISRVISNKGNVKQETREAIEKLLIEQNYRTNVMELRHEKARKHTVCIITGDLVNWYYMETLRNLVRLLDEAGYSAYIGFSDNDPVKEEKILREAVDDGCAGVMFFNVCGNENIKTILNQTAIPVVFLNRGIKAAYFNAVCNDNFNGAYQAVSYLITEGHRKIGHLMGNSFSVTAQDRRNGYVEAMEDHGLLVSGSSIYQGSYSWETGFAYGEHIIKKGLDFTAVFIGNYQMAEGFIDCMHDYGVIIPDRISVICFDETPEMRRNRITTICARADKMAGSAADLLIRQIEDPTVQSRRIYEEPVLIKRGSVKRLI